MPAHLHGWAESIDGAGAETELAAIPDTSGIIQVQSTDYLRIKPGYDKIAMIYAGIDQTVEPRVRLQAPSLDEKNGRDQTFIPFINSGAEPGSPPQVNDLRAKPIALAPGEDLRVLHLSNPAAATLQCVLAWFNDGPITPVDPSGGFWIRVTHAAAAMTAGVWNQRASVISTTLPVGNYEVLAARNRSTSAIATRFLFDGQQNRPGVLAVDAAADLMHPSHMVPGQLGVLGKFHSQTPPAVEWLTAAADNEAQEMLWYVRRV